MKYAELFHQGSHSAVVITAADRVKLRELGLRRNQAKDPSWTRRKSDVFNDAEVDELGLYGEWAAATYLGTKIDSTVTVTGDSGADLHWRGIDIAVKYNHRWRGFLMVETRPNDNLPDFMHDFQADLIVLTHGKCRPNKNDPELHRCYCREPGGVVVVMAGWLTYEEFVLRHYKDDLSLGDRYIVKCPDLHPMQTIWNYR